MCATDEPLDILFLILNILTKCCVESLRLPLRLTRALISYCVNSGFLLYVYQYFIEETFSDEVRDSVYPWLVYVAIICAGGGVLGYQAVRIMSDKMTWRTFYLTYKLIDIVLAGLNLVGIIVVNEKLEFDLWMEEPGEHLKDIALVVITSVDLVFDPVEIVIACCCLRNADN